MPIYHVLWRDCLAAYAATGNDANISYLLGRYDIIIAQWQIKSVVLTMGSFLGCVGCLVSMTASRYVYLAGPRRNMHNGADRAPGTDGPYMKG